MDIGPPELLIIAVIVLLLFGGAKIPKLARSLGQAQKEFKQGLDEGRKDDATTTPAAKPHDSTAT
ncbi:MAG: twin-arginine translocase TatA/TatE family subunit [Acidimicrobiia bacterium]